MAVLQTILSLFAPPPVEAEPEIIVPAPPTAYAVRPLTVEQLNEVIRLNMRCFPNGENYTRHTFNYLLNEPSTLSYRSVTPEGEMTGFAFVMLTRDGSGHLTSIGVAPEHRRRGIALMLLDKVEAALRAKGVSTIVLEVRVSNTVAQDLYRRSGYHTVQRLKKYYNNGEDGYLMMKSLV